MTTAHDRKENDALVRYHQTVAKRCWESTPYTACEGWPNALVTQCQQITAQTYARARAAYEHFYG